MSNDAQSVAQSADFDADAFGDSVSRELKETDPARLAVDMCVAQSFPVDPRTRKAAMAKGAVLFAGCAPGWHAEVASAIVRFVRPDVVREVEVGWRSRSYRNGGESAPPYVSLGTEDSKKKSFDSEARTALRDGHGFVQVAAPGEGIFQEIAAVADAIFDVPPPNGAVLARVACIVGTGDVAAPGDASVAGVLPEHLLVCMRPNQTAEEWMWRLVHVVGATRPASATATPVTSKRSAGDGGWTLDRLHGMDEAVTWARDLLEDVKLVRSCELNAAELSKGIVLAGPPGCGKTLLLSAIANSIYPPIHVVHGGFGKWSTKKGEGHLGNVQNAMKRDFDEARSNAPCILVVDELDSLPNRATLSSEDAQWWRPVVNLFLELCDGIQDRSGVVIVGATNHVHAIDDAVLRAGRMERVIRMRMPDTAALQAILREHLGSDLRDADLSRVALLLAGSSGADAARVVADARRSARRGGRRPLMLQDLIRAAAPPDTRTPAERKRACAHEAGHALASAILAPGSLRSVSVLQGSGMGGKTESMNPVGAGTPSEVETALRILLAGRAAEEEIIGSAGHGCGVEPESDLGQATELAAAAEMAFAGGPELAYRRVQPDKLNDVLYRFPAAARRVEGRLRVADDAVRAMLAHNRHVLLALVDNLERRGVLSADDVEGVIASARESVAPVRAVGHHVLPGGGVQ